MIGAGGGGGVREDVEHLLEAIYIRDDIICRLSSVSGQYSHWE